MGNHTTTDQGLQWLLQQNQHTRSLLIGSGIVCGLDIRVDEEDCTFYLSGGLGVSSDGKIIYPPKVSYHFTHYRPFEPLPEYPLFQNPDGEPIPVWELMEGRPEDEEGAGDENIKPLTPQNAGEELNLFIRDKVLIIYLGTPAEPEQQPEPEEEEPPADPVQVAKVASHGPGKKAKLPPQQQLYFLLIDQEAIIEQRGFSGRLKKIIGTYAADEDYVYSDAFSNLDDQATEKDIYKAQHPRLDLREVKLRRFGFGCLDPFDCQPEELEESQFPNIQSLNDLYREYVCIIDAATAVLDREMRRFHQLLQTGFYPWPDEQVDEILDQLCQKWEAYKKLNTLADQSRHKKEYVQYFYDWCRDLIMAYGMLRREFLDLIADCPPDTEAHPQHLLLGLVVRPPHTHYPAALRHHFLQPPIYNGNAARVEKIKVYHWRFLRMVETFYLPRAIPEKSLNPYCAMEEAGDEEGLPAMNSLKITPGHYYDWPLDQQSIPYYYPLSLSRRSLHHLWSFARVRGLTTDQSLSYHASDSEDSYSRHPHVIRPLRYRIDQYPFFRVEGLIGKELSEAVPVLEEWIRKYNLSFAVKVTAINALTEQDSQVDGKTFYTFAGSLQGADHLAGVKEGGTFVLVEEDSRVVADFSLPYRCCEEMPEPPPPDPESEIMVIGKIVHCGNDEPLAEMKVLIGSHTAISKEDGSFSISVLPATYKIAVEENEEFFGYHDEKELLVAQELSSIRLLPKQITVTGLLVRQDTPIPGRKMIIELAATGETLETQSDANGKFTFAGVPLGKQMIQYFLGANPQGFSFDAAPDDGCASQNILINVSDGDQVRPVPFENEFRAAALLNDRYFEAVAVQPQSDQAKQIAAFYDKETNAQFKTFATLYGLPEMESKASTESTAKAVEQLLNTTDLNLNQLHALHKSPLKDLDQDLSKATTTTEKSALLNLIRIMNSLYLDRVVLVRPAPPTGATLSELQESSAIGKGAFELEKFNQEWATARKGLAPEEFLSAINKLKR